MRSLQALYGREPTELELAAAKDADTLARLRSKLGREPTAEEVAAAREAALRDELTLKLGRKPTAVELARHQLPDASGACNARQPSSSRAVRSRARSSVALWLSLVMEK